MGWKKEFRGGFQAFFPVWLPIALLNMGKRNAMARPFLKANLVVFVLLSLFLG